jgi:hypothetical protein
MERTSLNERLQRAWLEPLTQWIAATPRAERYTLTIDATDDPCCTSLVVNGEPIAKAPGVRPIEAAEFAAHLAGLLPGLTGEHGKRVRSVTIEVA